MTNLLLKLVFRGNTDCTSPAVRSAAGTLCGVVGIVCNLLLFLLKGISGFLIGSISIMADAFNNLSDAGSSIITLLGFRMARRPADSAHPYGHARYEYISGLVVSFLILLVGLELLRNSILKIIRPTPVNFTLITFGILLISILVKLWLAKFYRLLAGRIRSAALEATAEDSRNDFLSTSAVLLACLINRYFHLNIDGIVGLCMACLILWSGMKMVKSTVSLLLGKRADPEFIGKLTQLVLAHNKIIGVHDVLVHDYGPGQCFASLHAELNACEDPLACHDIIDDIENDALERLNVHLVIHYDPVAADDPEWQNMHAITSHIINSIDPRLSMHDFRILAYKGQKKLAFDLAVPYGFFMTEDQIKLKVYEALAFQGKSYPVVIHFDSV